MRTTDRTEVVAEAIVNHYIEPPLTTDPMPARLAVEAKRFELWESVLEDRSEEELVHELLGLSCWYPETAQ